MYLVLFKEICINEICQVNFFQCNQFFSNAFPMLLSLLITFVINNVTFTSTVS